MSAGPVDVGALADLEDGAIARVRLGRRSVGVVRLGREAVAFADRCPHMGAPLCAGTIAWRLAGTRDGGLERAQAVLKCPWHAWEFDLRGGRALDDPGSRVRTYRTVVEGGRVLVDVGRHG